MKAKYIRLSLFGILISFIITACSSSRKSTMPVVFDPAGNWNYTVSNTPMGTITGTLNLMNDGVHWTAKMSSSLGVMPVETWKFPSV